MTTTSLREVATERYRGQKASCANAGVGRFCRNFAKWLVKRDDGSWALSCEQHLERTVEHLSRVVQ